MDAICCGLKENWILPEAFPGLTVTVDGFQGIQTDEREFAGRCSNNRTVLVMELLVLRHKGPRVHPSQIRNSRSCKELWAGVLSQRVKVKIIHGSCNEIYCSTDRLFGYVLVSKRRGCTLVTV